MGASLVPLSFLRGPVLMPGIQCASQLHMELGSAHCRGTSFFHSRLQSCFASSHSAYAVQQGGRPVKQTLYARAQTEQATEGVLEQGSADDEVCELVNGAEVELGGGPDTFNGYFTQALKNNNGAGILLLTDVFGYQDDATRDFVFRLACFGYNVLVPDLFRGKPWGKQRPEEEYDHWRELHPLDRVAQDIDTSAGWLAEAISGVIPAPKVLGMVGFCYGGGRLIEALARDTEGRYATAVSFYGTRYDPAVAAQIKVPVLLITGDSDPLSPVNVVHEVEKEVKGSQARVYSGRGHGFVHRPESVEDDEDAEDAFTVMRHWLHDHLLSTT